MRNPRRSLAATLSLAVLVGLPTRPPGEEAAVEETRAFGVPPGTRSVFEVKASTRRGGEPFSTTFTATIYRAPGDAWREVAAVFEPKEGSAPDPVYADPLPVALVRTARDGSLEGDRRGEIPESRSFLLSSLFFALCGPSIRPGSRWTLEALVPIAFLPSEVSLENEVEEAGPGKIRLRSRTLGEKKLSAFGFVMALRDWERDVLVDEGSGRPLEAKVAVRTSSGSINEDPHEVAVEIHAVEKEHRALSADEAAQLPDEIRRLRELEAAMDSGANPNPLSLLLGVRGHATRDPLQLLAEYEQAHPKGILSVAVPPLRETLRRRAEAERREKEREALAAKLVGAIAPDFTLEDLEGKETSLSGFRGKVVVLAFWGYG